jgi:hypothetical protein
MTRYNRVPEHMDSTDLAPEDPKRFGIRFTCVDCGARFEMAPYEYDGRWDHPPGEPRCPSCEEEYDDE